MTQGERCGWLHPRCIITTLNSYDKQLMMSDRFWGKCRRGRKKRQAKVHMLFPLWMSVEQVKKLVGQKLGEQAKELAAASCRFPRYVFSFLLSMIVSVAKEGLDMFVFLLCSVFGMEAFHPGFYKKFDIHDA